MWFEKGHLLRVTTDTAICHSLTQRLLHDILKNMPEDIAVVEAADTVGWRYPALSPSGPCAGTSGTRR